MADPPTLTAQQRWVADTSSKFVRIAVNASQMVDDASGNPLALRSTFYSKTPITETLPPVVTALPPTITYFTFSNAGAGTATAIPTWYWDQSTGTAAPTNLTVIKVYGDSSATPSTLLQTVSVAPTTLQFQFDLNPKVLNYYYKIVVTVSNDGGSAVLESTKQNTAAPVVTITSFAWGGTQGSTSALPTWTFTVTSSAPLTSYNLPVSVYSDTFTPPTTLIRYEGISNTSTSYQYNGTTTLNNYYKVMIGAVDVNGGYGEATSSVVQNSAPTPPTVTLSSFSWGGTAGGTSAKPTWTWTLSTGASAPTSLLVQIYSDATSPPTTLIATPTVSATTLTYTFTSATIVENYYKISVIGSNSAGSGAAMVDTQWNQIVNVQATGGTITQAGPYKTHTFTSDGTFTIVSNAGNQLLDTNAFGGGGGGGGGFCGGGGGGGGRRAASSAWGPNAYSVVIGQGGTGGNASGIAATNGTNTVVSISSGAIVTALGGGAGGTYGTSQSSGANGGCGGGAGYAVGATGGTGSQGGRGGTYTATYDGGGGGGCGGVTPTNANGANGINTSIGYLGGGGGGGGNNGPYGTGGLGGGGRGGTYPLTPADGTANTGGGGGGAGLNYTFGNDGGHGGSGIFWVTYLYI